MARRSRRWRIEFSCRWCAGQKTVARPARVQMRALDEHGEPVMIEADMPEARVLQHELDHLDGVLTLDRAEPADRRAALRELRRR